MGQPRDGVYVWITWLSKIMAGEQSCEWASWFKAHNTYSKRPQDFDIAAWTIEHTMRLRELSSELRTRGEQVTVESENSIKYVPTPGITLAGKADLISTSGSVVTIYDVKTGQPKTSDMIQVMIYMYLVPWTVPRYRGIQASGCVAYSDNRVSIPPHAITEKFADQFRYFLNVVTNLAPASKVPGPNECRFCDIPHTDCPERHIDLSSDAV